MKHPEELLRLETKRKALLNDLELERTAQARGVKGSADRAGEIEQKLADLAVHISETKKAMKADMQAKEDARLKDIADRENRKRSAEQNKPPFTHFNPECRGDEHFRGKGIDQ